MGCARTTAARARVMSTSSAPRGGLSSNVGRWERRHPACIIFFEAQASCLHSRYLLVSQFEPRFTALCLLLARASNRLLWFSVRQRFSPDSKTDCQRLSPGWLSQSSNRSDDRDDRLIV